MLDTELDRGLIPWTARRPLHALLGIFQILAALTLAPLAALSAGSRGDLVDGLVAFCWLALAALNLIPQLRPERFTFEIAMYAASLVAAVQVAVSARPLSPMLTGIEVLVLSLFAVFCLSVRQLYRWLTVTGAAFVFAVGWSAVDQAAAALIGYVFIALTALTVRQLVQQVVDASEHDPLTGALNRLGLRDRAELVRAYAHRRGEPTTVAVLDVDHFKAYNDRLGHTAGDRLLIEVVERLQGALRRSDLVARSGGDEFVIVLVGADESRTVAVLQRVLPTLPAHCSFGAAAWLPDSELNDAIDAADRAMYARRRALRGDTAEV
ncbi:MAG: GGDEF domain-containing protein [Candidatus Nanopelagicales bacterium]